jgi:hypothetical protein
MKKAILLLTALWLGTLSGCLPVSPQICRLWFFTYNDGRGTGIDSSLSPVSFLELRPDHSYTRDFGRFEYGSWEMEQQQLVLKNQFDEQIRFAVRAIKTDEMLLEKGASAVSHFEGFKLPSSAQNDPFSVTNNYWRIRASATESDQQLRDRLRSHMGFWESYFAWAMDNELTNLDVRSTPSPIKIYGNGFAVKPYADLPDSWKAFFYDSADCRRSTELLTETVRKNNIAWAHTDNKYKMFLSAFQQFKKFLK